MPVRPGTDSALAMGLIRWLLENGGFAADFLSLPSQAASDAVGDAGHTNATYLVITQVGHPGQGRFLRKFDLGLSEVDADDDGPMVMAGGAVTPADVAARGDLFVSDTFLLPDGSEIAVASSLSLLRDAALEHTLAEYATECGIPEARIVDIASRFKAAGRRAVVDCHGGMMSATGFQAAFGIQMLNLLAGSMNRTGGSSHGGGKFNGFGTGPRYDFASFPSMRKPKGVFLSRSRFPYEKSTEYQNRVAAGESPYPAAAPWRKLAPPVLTEHLASALDGYRNWITGGFRQAGRGQAHAQRSRSVSPAALGGCGRRGCDRTRCRAYRRSAGIPRGSQRCRDEPALASSVDRSRDKHIAAKHLIGAAKRLTPGGRCPSSYKVGRQSGLSIGGSGAFV